MPSTPYPEHLMPETRQITVRLTPDLELFWERKKRELQREWLAKGNENPVSNSSVFQGLVAFWRAMDAGQVDADR